MINESRCVCIGIAFAQVTLMYDAFISINNFTPYQAVLGRHPNLLPPLECGSFGDLDVSGQNNLARIREIIATSIVEAIAKMRLARDDKRNQVASVERSEHLPGDLVDIWYGPRIKTFQGGVAQHKSRQSTRTKDI